MGCERRWEEQRPYGVMLSGAAGTMHATPAEREKGTARSKEAAPLHREMAAGGCLGLQRCSSRVRCVLPLVCSVIVKPTFNSVLLKRSESHPLCSRAWREPSTMRLEREEQQGGGHDSHAHQDACEGWEGGSWRQSATRQLRSAGPGPCHGQTQTGLCSCGGGQKVQRSRNRDSPIVAPIPLNPTAGLRSLVEATLSFGSKRKAEGSSSFTDTYTCQG